MLLIRKKAYARAGLVGNPSDGYHGKTIAADRAEFLRRGHALRVGPESSWSGARKTRAASARSTSWCATCGCTATTAASGWSRRRSRSSSSTGRAASIRFTAGTFRSATRATSRARSGWPAPARSSSPRSAALMEFYGVEIPPGVQPSLVLSVETEELGIAAGLQDRVIQVYEGAGLHGFRPRADAQDRRA